MPISARIAAGMTRRPWPSTLVHVTLVSFVLAAIAHDGVEMLIWQTMRLMVKFHSRLLRSHSTFG